MTALVLAAMAPPAVAGNATSDLEEAHQLLDEKDFEKAVKAFRKAHKREDARSFGCAIGRATAYNGVGAFKNAAESAQEALELAATPQDRVAALIQQGAALYAKGNTDAEGLQAAERALREALEVSGGAVNDVRFPLGVILLKQERDEEGVAILEEFLVHEPEGRAAKQARSYAENPLRARIPLVPEFEIVTLDGEYLTPEDLLGKVVLLDFWGTWCGPCVASIPHLRGLSKRSAKKPFVMVGISTDRDEVALRRFVAENEMAWPQYLDAKREVAWGIFEVTSYPTYVLVDHEGVVVYRSSGWSSRAAAELDRQVAKAIRAAKKAAD